MVHSLNPETRRVLAERVQYYRELGIYDLYRRDVPENIKAALNAVSSPEVTDAPNRMEIEPSVPKTARKKPSTKVEVPAQEIANLPEDRPAALSAIREEIGDCKRCPLHKQGRKQIVFGVGNPNAEIMFVGEAPGADEDEQGEPFVGRAGQLLNNMIKAMGIRREDVYIANVIKCRPPQNRTPEPGECAICSPFLLRQIDVIRPRAIVALGAVAAKTLLAVNQTMGEMRGHWHDFHGFPLAVTYHPAYLLRDPRQKAAAWQDLQMVMHHLGMAVPSKEKHEHS